MREPTRHFWAKLKLCPPLPWWLGGEESTASAEEVGLIPGSGRSPGGGHGQPTPVFLPAESHGQRSLLGYSPWGCKESAMSEGT